VPYKDPEQQALRNREYSRRSYLRRKEAQGRGYDLAKYLSSQLSPRTRANRLLNAARSRGKYEVTITTEFIQEKIERGVCEATGLPFDLSPGNGPTPWAPSLDRIDNSLGYTPNNSRVVVWMFNAAKGTTTDEDVLTLAEALCLRKRS